MGKSQPGLRQDDVTSTTDQTSTANTFSQFQPPVRSTPALKVIKEQPGAEEALLERTMAVDPIQAFLMQGGKELNGAERKREGKKDT